MLEKNRRRRRRRLDEELRPFQRELLRRHPTNGLLRAVRRALGVPVAEIGALLGVADSVVFAHERSELNNTIQMNTLSRVAEAMGCRVVYGIVPKHGETLEALATERAVRKILKSRERKDREQGSGTREQEDGDGEDGEQGRRLGGAAAGEGEELVGASSSQLSAVRTVAEALCAEKPFELRKTVDEDGLRAFHALLSR